MNDIQNFFNSIITNYQKQIINEYPSIEIIKLQKIWENMNSLEKNIKKKSDSKKPTKKKTAYQNFFVITRKQLTDENSKMKFGEISKIISAKWNSLSTDEKKKYEVKVEPRNIQQQLNSISSTPYINLFEQDDDEKSKNDVNRSAYEHDEDEDLDDALSDIDEDDENLDELNFDDDMD